VTLDEALTVLTQAHPWLLGVVLFGSSLIEYVFPPFPGDTVTLAGAVLVTAYGASAPLVLAAVLLGSVAGAALDYAFGVLLVRSRWPLAQRHPWVRRARDRAEAASRAFARHGEAVLLVNRFLPGVRAFLFVAAGIARMRFARVLAYATLSSLLWNLLLLAAGMAVGSRLEDLERLFRTYQAVVWAILGVVGLWFAVRLVRRRRARARASAEGLHDRSDHPAE